MGENDTMQAMLQQEIEVLQQLSHPHILNVFEVLEDGENIYIANELCEGGELFDRLIQVKKFNEESAASIIE